MLPTFTWLKAVLPAGATPSPRQRAKDLIAAIDAGGLPLNPARVNDIARQLGLEVSIHAPMPDTISRIRSALMQSAKLTLPTAKESMSNSTHFYEPRLGHGLKHDPFNAIVGPRPIGWISTQSAAGLLNLAPYSFFNAFNYTPPIIGFASIGYKDTLRNIEETGEFVWNLVTRPLAEAMNQTCASVGPQVSEFTLSGLTPTPSRVVAVPRVMESPVTFECRRTQILQLQGVDGDKVETWLVLGEVVAVHIAQHLLKDGVYDTAASDVVLRGGGPADYFSIGPEQLFQMRRPT